MIDRRGFLKAILAAGVAPYISTTAGVLMPVRQRTIWLWGDGVHDDTEALQALFDGRFVRNVGSAIATSRWTGMEHEIFLSGGRFLMTSTMQVRGRATIMNNYFTGRLDRAPLFQLPGSEVEELKANIEVK